MGGVKVTVLEYNRLTADVVGVDALRTADWPEDVAPRHVGILNLLLNDGSVSAMLPDAIDPRVSANHDQWWLPERSGF